MKKLILMSLIFCFSLSFSGCITSTGQAIWDSRVSVYKVVKKGVTTFMTEEEIKALQLDKASTVIEYAYSIDKETGKKIEDSSVTSQDTTNSTI